MPDDAKTSQDKHDALERALLAFDQQLESDASQHLTESLPAGTSPTTEEDTSLELQANVETLRLLDAVRIEESQRDAPHLIGRFEIIKELGRGGHGIVMLARDPRLNRLVALKVPRPEAMVTPDLRARFLREAEAAALLRHPHILPIYEQGSVGPICYIAMEYCEGPSLLAWLDKHGPLPPRVAASVANQLAEALQHAHTRGVLHRDIKPANVLLDVTTSGSPSEAEAANNGEPSISAEDVPLAVRLTDFGLARVGDNQDQTKTGEVLGTPLFMAPEQVAGRKHDIAASTDVYALGATLYYLLTGQPPLRGETEVQTFIAIQDQDPQAPSHHNDTVSADLDAICLKCLEKNPERRYLAASELAEDLQRFLAGKPVGARKITTWLKASRWCARNPWLAAAAATVVMTTLASLAWITHERNVAVAEAKRATDILQIVTDSFDSADVTLGASPDMTAKAVLMNAKTSILDSDVDAAGRAALLDTLTQCYMNLGEYHAAVETAEEKLAALSSIRKPDDPDFLTAKFDLGAAYRWTERYDEGAQLLKQVLIARGRVMGANHPDTISAKSALAACYYEAEEYEQAVGYFEDVFNRRRQLLGEDHRDTLNSQGRLGAVYGRLGQLEQAISHCEAAIEGLTRTQGADDAATVSAIRTMGSIYFNNDRVAESIPIFEHVLDWRVDTYGADHLDTHVSRYNLGQAYQLNGQAHEAIPVLEAALTGFDEGYATDKPSTLLIVESLEQAYADSGQELKAQEMRKRMEAHNPPTDD